jgi:hypothetical protein
MKTCGNTKQRISTGGKTDERLCMGKKQTNKQTKQPNLHTLVFAPDTIGGCEIVNASEELEVIGVRVLNAKFVQELAFGRTLHAHRILFL